MTDYINHILNIFVNFLSQISLDFVDLVEIAVLFSFLFLFYKKYIAGTHSEKFVKGLLILVVMWALSEVLILINLNILGYFLKTVVSIIVLSLVVVFQPELRKLIGYLGQSGFFNKEIFAPKPENSTEYSLNQVIEAVKYCSKVHRGMLLVFGRQKDDLLVSEVGTPLNADISAPLLLTIFHPNTPLHDGATLIAENRIIAAGVLLPLTEDPKLSWKYGTRHRAAIGMSEASSCVCLVVSEETGDISLAFDGTLKKYEDIALLRKDLASICGVGKDEKSKVFDFGFSFKNTQNKDSKK